MFVFEIYNFVCISKWQKSSKKRKSIKKSNQGFFSLSCLFAKQANRQGNRQIGEKSEMSWQTGKEEFQFKNFPKILQKKKKYDKIKKIFCLLFYSFSKIFCHLLAYKKICPHLTPSPSPKGWGGVGLATTEGMRGKKWENLSLVAQW